ncbi:HPr-rel-A system PqqD family peptide chaperone [Lentisalinibacter orientalis]|uniref:HPr-rel-A system PqqD family peptide chaperone n=1 Tax=Lentisalinibacter orientalis TaxID=2992241 RepID=UPI00386E2F78
MRPRSSDDSPSWYVPFPDDLIWASWGDSYVAYHRPSGKTHFLNSASHELLCEVLRESADIEAIARDFAPVNDNDGVVSSRDREQLAALLNHLEELGLVRRA